MTNYPAHKPFALLLCIVCLASLASCATTPRDPNVGVVYPSSSVEKVQVLARSEELVSASSGRVGRTVASTAGSYGAGIVGSLLGGLIGPAIEKGVVKERVSRYTLRKANGNTVTLLQKDTANPIPVGATAYLIKHPEKGTSTLVRHHPST